MPGREATSFLNAPWTATKLKHVNQQSNGDAPVLELDLPPGERVLFVTTPNGIASKATQPPAYSAPPINFLWLAAVLLEHGVEVKIVDGYTRSHALEQILEEISEFQPRIVGYSCFTISLYDTLHLIRAVKERFPRIASIVGGYHANVSIEELIGEPAVDFVCHQEGEFLMPELLNQIVHGAPLNELPGLVYREGGDVVRNTSRDLRRNFDAQPHLPYELLELDAYRPWAWNFRPGRDRFVATVTGKGCPLACEFCDISKTEGVTYRRMSYTRVVDELAHMNATHGINQIEFYDPLFTLDTQRVFDVCAEIVRRGLRVTWGCSSTIHKMRNAELAPRMYEAGCRNIFFGIESGNRDIMANIKAGMTPEMVREVVRKTQAAGIRAHCSFVFGLEGDTEATVEESIQFALELNPDTVSFSVAQPYPGTKLWDRMIENDYLLTRDWRDYSAHKGIWETPDLSAEYVEEQVIRAHRRFYLRPSYIARRFWRMRSASDFRFAARIGWDFARSRVGYRS